MTRTRLHDKVDGRHNNSKGQHGDMRHDDGDRRQHDTTKATRGELLRLDIIF